MSDDELQPGIRQLMRRTYCASGCFTLLALAAVAFACWYAFH